MSKKPQTYFQKNWLQMPKFAQWLHDVKMTTPVLGARYVTKKLNSQAWES